MIYDFQGRNYVVVGFYEVILLVVNGCDSMIYLVLFFYDFCIFLMFVDVNSIVVFCVEVVNGQIEVFVEGIFFLYRYSLDNQLFQLFLVFVDLDFGQYSIEVEDVFGCS